MSKTSPVFFATSKLPVFPFGWLQRGTASPVPWAEQIHSRSAGSVAETPSLRLLPSFGSSTEDQCGGMAERLSEFRVKLTSVAGSFCR